MSEALLLVVLTLATARLTRLVTTDAITSSMRVRWFKRFPPQPTNRRRAHPLGILVSCDWCVSVWSAAGVVAATVAFWSVPLPFLTWAAVAEGAALIAARLDA